MIKFVLWTLLAFLAIAFESTLFTGSRPDLLLILVCFYALKHDLMQSLLFGAVSGLLFDAANGFIIGSAVISKVLTGFVVVSVKKIIFGWGRIVHSFIIFLSAVMDYLIFFICLNTFNPIPSYSRSLESIILDIAYTTLFGLILFPFVKKIYFEKQSQTN